MSGGGAGLKRERKKGVDGEGEEEDSQADIQSGSKGAVPPPLSGGGGSKSEHSGLMSMWFANKRWYHCEHCDYLNDRLYHRFYICSVCVYVYMQACVCLCLCPYLCL